MDRYIDAEKAFNSVGTSVINSQYAISIIKSAPTEDVAPVIHAHWYHRPNVWGEAYCSNCDFAIYTNDTNYCPDCGAKMDEEMSK